MMMDWSPEDDRYAKGDSCTHRLTAKEEAVMVVFPFLLAPQ